MKGIAFFLLPALVLALVACNGGNDTATDTNKADSTNSGSTANFKLGVQMWTFRMFPFAEALNKVDSAGIKNIEAYWGQELGGGMTGAFGPDMNADTRSKLKQLLQSKGINIVAMGVIGPKDQQEWIKAFELAKDFGLSYITSEPNKAHWDMIDSLAGSYGVKVAIHEHPRPNPYWHPDSALAAIQGRENIGACADIGHWERSGITAVEALKMLDGHIIGVHLKDIVKFNDLEAADTTVSQGVINVPAVLAELKRQNFDGMLSIEHESNWYHSLPDIILTKNYYEEQLQQLK